MISYLSGKIQHQDLKSLTINVNGVGYQVHTTLNILEKSQPNAEIPLHIHTHVREDCLELYGFETREELDFFEKLISVSGIGPKSGLGVFAVAKVSELKQAIVGGDATLLTKVSGIGQKTAERIVIELRNKIGDFGTRVGDTGFRSTDADALDALLGLGYSRQQAVEALRQAGEGTVEERLKHALKILGQK